MYVCVCECACVCTCVCEQKYFCLGLSLKNKFWPNMSLIFLTLLRLKAIECFLSLSKCFLYNNLMK